MMVLASKVVTSDELMTVQPRRALEWCEGDDGRCVLLRPKCGRSRIGRWLAIRMGDPHYRIRLDDVGTFVWKSCDGHTRLATIAERMRDRFGPSVEPAEQRLVAFVMQMGRSRLLELPQPAKDIAGGGQKLD